MHWEQFTLILMLVGVVSLLGRLYWLSRRAVKGYVELLHALQKHDASIGASLEALQTAVDGISEKDRKLDYDFEAAQRAAQEINRMNAGVAALFGYDGAPQKRGDGE